MTRQAAVLFPSQPRCTTARLNIAPSLAVLLSPNAKGKCLSLTATRASFGSHVFRTASGLVEALQGSAKVVRSKHIYI